VFFLVCILFGCPRLCVGYNTFVLMVLYEFRKDICVLLIE